MSQRFSLVVPVYNEEAMIPLLSKALSVFLSGLSRPSEIIVVDDGSSDRTLQLLLEWGARDPCVVVVQLSRNFGHQNAVMAGLANATGDLIGIIDGDLQDPPEVMGAMIEEVEKGFDVVYAVRMSRKEGVLMKSAYWLAYRIINAMAERPMPMDSGDFAVMRRPVVEQLLKLNEQRLFLRGLRSWVGFTQVAFPYERHARAQGASKYRFKQLWRLLRDGIYGFTSFPMRLMRWTGFIVILGSTAYSAWLFGALFFGIPAPRGFATLALALCFFGGTQLLATGIIGEYVARIYDDVRGRPRFIIQKTHKFEK